MKKSYKNTFKMRTFYMLLCSLFLIACDNGNTDGKLITKDSTFTWTDTHETPPPPPPPVKNDSSSPINKKQPRATDNEHWKKKKAEGVDFMVIGNEPFWNLEIRNNKSLRFHLSDWEQPVNIEFAGSVEKSRFNELSARDIEVRIEPKECSDGMSDYWYDYSVTVIYKGKTYNGCGISL